VLELYCGAGALTVSLARAVGPAGAVGGGRGAVRAFEADVQAVADATANLRAQAADADATVRRMRITPETVHGALAEGPVDLIVVDPPRSGLGQQTTTALLAAGARAIGYVACDPAALARDVAVALAAGWQLCALRGYDAFPMTHHVECIAMLEPPPL
jgi:tRNA/tmRNA/rRNA uracil-C5-methylase (TrmA/RlmC/RlmD family)